MCQAADNSHKTAITRKKLSSAAQYLVDNDMLQGDCLDFGCGKGFDCDELGIDGFDPHHRPTEPTKKYDTIMCNFVLNTLPGIMWQSVLEAMSRYLKDGGVAYVSVRNDKSNLKGFTKTGTFQTVVDLDLPVVKKTSNFVMYKLER